MKINWSAEKSFVDDGEWVPKIEAEQRIAELEDKYQKQQLELSGAYNEIQRLTDRIAELEAENNRLIKVGYAQHYGSEERYRKRLDAVMPLLENWMLYYTDGISDDDLRDLYCASVEALEQEE